jgi:nucleoside-diphosphate-sugar epimerase
VRVLVTGATGFVGSAVRRNLLATGHAVVATARSAASEDRSVEWRPADLLADASAEDVARGCDAVIHCVGAMPADAGAAFRINTEALRRVVASARRHGVSRFVYVSSTAVYGDSAPRPVREETPLLGAGAYARSKIAAERILLAADDVGPCVVRPCMITGRGDRQIVPALRALVAQPVVPLPGGGRALLHLVAVDDVAAAACELALRAEHLRGPFNLAAAEPITLRTLLASVAAGIGVVPHFFEPTLDEAHALLEAAAREGREPPIPPVLVAIAGADHHYAIDRARRELGFAPARPIADIVRAEAAREV